MRAIEEATGLGDDPLWAFALEVYGRPGVAEACLALQDRHGADVNLMLWALWAGARLGRKLDVAAVEEAARLAGNWAEAVVRPLRAARRAMKTGIAGIPDDPRLGLRERVKTVELAAERVELAALFALSGAAPGIPPGREEAARLAADNLRRLLRATAPPAEGEDERIATLARAAAGQQAPFPSPSRRKRE